MKTYTITESKTRLSALVEEVATTGKSVVIGRGGRPMVKLVPYSVAPIGRRIGAFRGQIKIADGFKQWEGEEAAAFGMTEE